MRNKAGTILGISFLISTMALTAPCYAQFNFFKKAQNKGDEPVEVTADQIEYLKGKQKVVGTGNVVVVHGSDYLYADYAEVNTETKTAFAKGHVVLVQGAMHLVGPEVTYDFKTHTGTFPDGKFASAPFFGSGSDIEQLSKNKARLRNGFITTCDLPHNPHYGVSAKKAIIYFDDKIVAENCFVEVLGKRVFWWPYLTIPLNGHAPFTVKPGYSDDMGAYALVSKGFSINKNIGGQLHYDYRSKRGHAVGADADYDSGILGNGFIRTYYARDERSPDYKASDPNNHRIEDDRYWLKWYHRANIDDYTRAVVEYNRLHDRYVLKDFFEKEYRSEADPKTYLEVVRNTERYGVFVNVEKRVNHFVDTVERLPEVRFNWNNQEIGNSNIYYQNETSIVSFNQKFAHSSIDNDVVRGDFFNEIEYPTKIGFIHVDPYLNARQDYYNKNKYGKENITRNVAGGGVDASTRFFRLFDVSGDKFGFEYNQIRHILEPSVSYRSVREVSVLKDTLFSMDSIDTIDDLDVVTFGLRNKIQTKRFIGGELRRVDLLSTAQYLNYEFNREEAGGSKWIEFLTEVEFRPYTWLIMYHKNIWDMIRDQFKEAEFDVEIQGSEKWHFYLSHKFVDERATNDPSSLLTMDAEYTINDLWKIGGYIRHEFDTAKTEEWEIRFKRDLHCWNLEFGVNRTNNDEDKVDWSVFFEMVLKAFPDYNLKSGHRAEFSRARFGDLIGGESLPAGVSGA